MLLQVQLTLLQKNFEGGGTGPPPRSAPGTTSLIGTIGKPWHL